MTIFEILGYIGAFIMGGFLGLIGGGGSILTVPILVYLFKIEPILATAYSLFNVGLASLIGAHSHIKRGNIDWKNVFFFGIPSILSVYFARYVIVPKIPPIVFSIGNFEVNKSMFVLVLFSIIMLVSAFSMVKKSSENKLKERKFANRNAIIIIEGIIVGFITGLVGAGGGFLILPTLVVLGGISMKKAIGTSLLIIAAKSLIGFLGDVINNPEIDWIFLFTFSSIAIVGIIFGGRFSTKISNDKLKPLFGYFILVMGIFILLSELLLN